MRNPRRQLWRWFGVLGLVGSVSAAHVPEAKPTRALNHVLVQVNAEGRRHLHGRPAGEALSDMLARFNLPTGARLREPHVSQLLRGASHRNLAGDPDVDLDRFLYLDLPPGLSVDQAIARLRTHPWIEYVEPDGFGSGGGITPNDPNFGNQWHHRNPATPSAAIRTPDAWAFTQGSTNVIVAVLDSGLRTNLTEFTGRLVPGYNFVSNNTNVDDDHGHGTAVAGTLGANANNATLVAGVDWRCRIMPVKVLDQSNNGFYSWWAQGIDFAVANGAKVLNLSAGGIGSSTTLTRAIQNAIARGVIFVTITHNQGSSSIQYPGSLMEAITVGATDAQDRRCGFSNYGPQIDLVAPGTNIYTVSRSGGLTSWWGTSFAAPQVAGVCALLAALRPDLNQEQARTLLVAGADDQVGDGSDIPGFDLYYGWGRLNAYQSLLLAQTCVDEVRLTATNRLVLSWTSPANASNKQPYQVEFATTVSGGPWTPLTASSQLTYGNQRTYVTVPVEILQAPARYYRVKVRGF